MEILIACAVGAYLIGSIPFGLILTKLAGHGDIRQIGSGNIGATNVLRTGNKGLALLTLALDFGKGFVALFLYANITGRSLPLEMIPYGLAMRGYTELALLELILPTFIVLGHMFPIWLKFKGGKGVACLFGIGFALSPILSGWMAMCWLTIFALYRYSSLSAILGIPAALVIAHQNEAVGELSFMLALPTLLMIAKHHENIRRLLKGEEHKFSFIKKDKD